DSSPGFGLPRFTVCWSTRLSRSLNSRVCGGASFLPASGGLTICCSGSGIFFSGGGGGAGGGGGSSVGFAAFRGLAASCGGGGGLGAGLAAARGGGGSMMRTGNGRCGRKPGRTNDSV